ncbi:hypothetical protein QZH41_008222 [Actinostola sp. cb2023]|nr:hypothetical protein QZH41_008222 [Actinostola sp. cb2023]
MRGCSCKIESSSSGFTSTMGIPTFLKPYVKWKYLGREELAGFDRYKYKSIDSSPVSNYITHPFWNCVVKSITGVYLVTYVYGTEFWKSEVLNLGFKYTDVFRIIVYGSSVLLTLPMCCYYVYIAHRTNSGRGISVKEGLTPFFPLVTSLALFTVWGLISPSDIINAESKLFITALGIVYSNITCRLIVNTMCYQPCERFNHLLYPLIVLVLLVPFLHGSAEYVALAFYTIIVAIAQLHYGISVVNELCDHLKIKCFTLKKT